MKCLCCKNSAIDGSSKCGSCLAINRSATSVYRERRKAMGLCVACGKNKLTSKIYCEICRDKLKQRFQIVKMKVYEHYGVRCNCCGESEVAFLTIDHVNNDGAKHRKEMCADGYSIYAYIIRKNFPDDFQVLCRNCNWGKHSRKVCPHKLKQEALT
jgi:hypothetical protein